MRSMKTSGVVVLAGLWAVAILAGCGSDGMDASTTTGNATSGGGAGGATFGAGACRNCERAACAAEFSACEAEPECGAFIGCENACPTALTGDVDATCVSACPSVDEGTAKTAFDALQACRYGAPGAACQECGRGGVGGGGGAGGAGICTPPAILTQECQDENNGSECTQCQYEKCCDSVDLVFGGGPATDLGDCWLNCNTPQCEADCFEQFPDGIPGFAGYQACVFVNCFGTGACSSSSSCSLCQYKECSCEFASCTTNVECFAIRNCLSLCATNDTACGKECYDKHPDGQVLFDTLAICTGQRCIAQCGG